MRWTIGRQSAWRQWLSGMTCHAPAEAQAVATMQATATVVDTRQGFEALSRVQQVVRSESRTKSAVVVQCRSGFRGPPA